MRLYNFIKLSAAAIAALTLAASSAAAQKRVVATTPDLASIAREIGGSLVSVTSLAKPTEDPHFVDAKPSHIVTLNRADALIEGGAELELGWLPPLLENSRNPKIAGGAPGRIVASQGIRMLEVPTSFDRSKGDVHSMGNPHFLIDPLNVKIIATHIADHFAQIDPKNAAVYRSNLAKFNARLDSKLTQWQGQLAPFRRARIVTYHKDFVYLGLRFGLQIIETLEPKPGIAPSPSHLASVIGTMRRNNAHVILVQPFQNRKTAETVARQTTGVILDIAQQPGARSGTGTYFDLMDYIVTTLANALRAQK